MKRYFIKRILYTNKQGRYCTIKLNNVELRYNTDAFAGYWDISLGEVEDMLLEEGDTGTFEFRTHDNFILKGQGKVQSDRKGGYTLIGKKISYL